ncbi:polysaccharide deacetylase family protein [Saccharothrix algeriensis]|uniref:Peptidoglycan/xylan/chitin deacetylase (PgdA/CDA1 family) n=1 Tax=Saccharothrix algeriensis TaxID=173560 RepID=A0A8T8I2N0_9PSEU|nr:polysaccharide deacetylase family protein [Saccharothrix algeriensis]MBM7811171.1 peptidoglycan/xylan/chitin deacetylase (PgdA/CDA1 family) [Saccharothrix algeriensis]QTR05092.1 polysaccharide deacetylase family protein [Saccharothrix algeriensis]
MLLRTLLVVALLLVAPAVPANAAAPRCSGHVALTYDDGPTAGHTRPLLAALRSVGARATFFDIGSNAERHPDLVRATARAGMWLGNHSWSHPRLTTLTPEELAGEIADTQDGLRHITGRTPKLFRPPYGDTNAAVREEARRQGLTEVLWTVDTRDWSGVSTEAIVRSATSATAGGVVLMHDGYQNTVDAVPQIVRGLRAKGLCPGRITADGRVVAP